MKELTIHYIPATGTRGAQTYVSYKGEDGAATQTSPAADFDFAMPDETRADIQWYLETYLLYPWGTFCTRAEDIETKIAHLGVDLFRAVFGSERARQLYSWTAECLPETSITVHAGDPAGIAIPWELLRDPLKADYGELAHLAHSFTRSQSDLVYDLTRPAPSKTLNILMVICRPGEPGEEVDFQSVARPLLQVFRPHGDRIHLDVLRPPTFEQLQKTLAAKPRFYHVLHFDGHGDFPTHSDARAFFGAAGQQGCLLFENADGKPDPVSGTRLGQALAGKGIQAVILNACRSGMTDPRSAYPSVGNQLLKAGVRGVVAMAYSVYVQTAALYMKELYQALANGAALNAAASTARGVLHASRARRSAVGEVDLQDWIVPVVFQAAPFQPFPGGAQAPALALDPGALSGDLSGAGTEINCPRPPTFGLIGRDAVTLDLERAFQHETVVLLHGMAGVGKTEMAAGFARWRAETGALQGPVFFFKFEHYLPLEHVVAEVGRVFNPRVRQQLGQDWEQINDENARCEIVTQILRAVPCFLIWDNFEPVAGFPAGTPSEWNENEQKALLAFLDGLRGGHSKVLVTSRRPEKSLEQSARFVELGGLRLDEAQRLAVDVLRRAGADTAALRALPDYNALLRYLRGNPLAIQVILPELKTRDPADLLDALQKGEAVLSADNPALGREGSLAASLSYRLEALDPRVALRLGLVGLFQGFVDADVLEAICAHADAPELVRGLKRADWLPMLDAAAEVGLLQAIGGGYYSVHPALPWFFHARLHAALGAQVTRAQQVFARVYAAYGSFLRDKLFPKDARLAMQLLAAEEGNLRQALRLARQAGDEAALRGILDGFNQLYDVQGRWTEWERLLSEIFNESVDGDGRALAGRERLWVRLQGHRAEMALWRRDLSGAEEIYLQLKTYFQDQNDQPNLAVSLHQLGRVAGERGRLEEAEDCYRQSLEIRHRIGDEQGKAGTLHQLGVMSQKRGRLEEAEGWYGQSLAISRRLGDEPGQAISLHQLGMVAQERGRLDEAEDCYRQSLEISRRVGNEPWQAISLHQLGMVAEDRRRLDEAEDWYRQSLEIERRVGDEPKQAATLGQLGNVAFMSGRLAEALTWMRQAEAIFASYQDARSLEITRKNIRRVEDELRGQGGA